MKQSEYITDDCVYRRCGLIPVILPGICFESEISLFFFQKYIEEHHICVNLHRKHGKVTDIQNRYSKA